LYRYAILWDRLGEESQPIGLAIQRGDHVLVDVPDEYGIRSRFDGEYRVVQPDATRIVYRPDDSAFFDQVLLDLSNSFAVGQQGEVETPNLPTITGLLTQHVFEPRDESRIGEYTVVCDRPPHWYVRDHRSAWARATAPAPAAAFSTPDDPGDPGETTEVAEDVAFAIAA
jgi:hypothetical protein